MVIVAEISLKSLKFLGIKRGTNGGIINKLLVLEIKEFSAFCHLNFFLKNHQEIFWSYRVKKWS